MFRLLAALAIAIPAAAQSAGQARAPAPAQQRAPAPDEDMPSMGDLIAVAFPKWADDTDGRLQTIPESKLTQRWSANAAPKAKQRKVLVEPALVLRAAPGRYVLLATLHPAADDGVAEWSQSTPAGLAAYTFTTSATGWKLLKRQEPFDVKGYESAARIEPVRLSDSVQGIVTEYGSCWQGKCGRWISVYEIGKDGVKPAAIADMPLAADNLSRPECAQNPQAAECFRVDGRWRIEESLAAPGAFVVDYNGSRGAQTVRYQWRGARYDAGSGVNPVPKIQ